MGCNRNHLIGTYFLTKVLHNIKNNTLNQGKALIISLYQTCRYNFKAYIADPSATVPVTFFSPAADDIVGYSCSYLLAKHNTQDLQEIPEEIFAIEGEQNIFQIHYNTTAQTTDFVLDQVFNKKNPKKTKQPN